jgi:ferrous iron transport protein A
LFLKSDFIFDYDPDRMNATLPSTLPLARLAPGQCAEVKAVDGSSPIGRRLLELGFRPGTRLRVIRRAPLGDPTTYELRGSRFCLRRAEAERISVAPLDAAASDPLSLA